MTYENCQLRSNAECKTFIGTLGVLDLDSFTIASSGNVSAASPFQFNNDVDGGSITIISGSGALSGLTINNIDFSLAPGVSLTADSCEISNSTVTYVTAPGDATAETNTDGGGNVGWSFAAIVSAVLSSASIFISKMFRRWIR